MALRPWLVFLLFIPTASGVMFVDAPDIDGPLVVGQPTSITVTVSLDCASYKYLTEDAEILAAPAPQAAQGGIDITGDMVKTAKALDCIGKETNDLTFEYEMTANASAPGENVIAVTFSYQSKTVGLGEDSAKDDAAVRVAFLGRLEAETPEPQIDAEGKKGTAWLTVTNLGNSVTQVEVTVAKSPWKDLRVEPEAFPLDRPIANAPAVNSTFALDLVGIGGKSGAVTLSLRPVSIKDPSARGPPVEVTFDVTGAESGGIVADAPAAPLPLLLLGLLLLLAVWRPLARRRP